MRKITNWMFAAIFFCGATMLTSCGKDDNPVEPEVPVISQERQAFEAELSNSLQKAAEKIRFDAYKNAMQTLGNFILTLDKEALQQQVTAMIPELLTNLQPIKPSDLTEEELNAVGIALDERFGMTLDELNALGGFIMVDAYNTIGTKKVTFQNGVATQSENDGFTIENIDAEGNSSSITLKFADERDGVRLFVARLGGAVPVCIQLPEMIDITITTSKGVLMSGSVIFATDNPTQYISFLQDRWTISCNVASELNGRNETIGAYVFHGSDRSYDIGAALNFDGVEKFSIYVKGMNKPYPEEYIKSEELKSLRDCGPFFSGAYDVLKAINGSTVDEIVATLNGKVVISAKVDDIAGSLLALGNIRKMHGTQPGFEAVDKYTQELNDKIHFDLAIKGTDVKAEGSLVTIPKGFKEMEFQPGVALQFAGEKEPIAIFDRMTEEDMANYRLLMDNISELGNYFDIMLKSVQEKFKDFKVM